MEQLDLQQSNRPFRDNFRTCAGTLPDGKAARFYCKVLDKYFEIKGVLNLITCSMGVFWERGVELSSDFLTSQYNN
jgi:hypothetical protein